MPKLVKKVKNVEKQTPIATTTVINKSGKDVVNESSVVEELGIPVVIEEPVANIGLSVAYTKNLGNYESVKMQVSLHMPTKPDSLDEAFNYVREWCDGKLEKLVSEIESD